MNSRQRVAAAISNRVPDRIPLWDVAHFGGFIEKWRRNLGVGDEVLPRDYYGYDTSICIGDETFFPSRQAIIKETESIVVRNDGWGRTIKARRTGYFSQVLEYYYPDPSSLVDLAPESPDLEERFTSVYSRLNEDRERDRYVFAKTGGMYTRTHFLLPEEELLVKMALDSGFCHALFDRVAEHLTRVALQTLHHTNGWVEGIWVFDDMAGTYSPVFHPDMFATYLLPLYKRMISVLRDAGCRHFYFHSDGNILPLLDMLIETGFEGFHPLEPRSGLDIVQLRKKYGDSIVLFGGICNTEILPRGDLREIEAHLQPLVEVAADGGVVLGMASAAGDIAPEAYDHCMKYIVEGR